MVAAGMLLIIAYLSLGALLQLLTGDLATGLGLAGLIASPAFGYAGVGFPTIGMNTFAQVWSSILPLRWYMTVLLGQAARGLPVSDSAVPFAALAGLALLFAGLALLRMASLKRKGWFETARACRARRRDRRRRDGVGGAFTAEWRRVLGTRSAFSPAVPGSAALRHLLSATLSEPDPSQASHRGRRQRSERSQPPDRRDTGRERSLERRGSHPNLGRGARRHRSRTGLCRRRYPPGTERDVLKGITAHIPIYADATYLFVFRSTASGVATAIGTLTSDLVSRGARSDGSLVKAKLASSSPADVLLQPIFNPVGGYASYVVPAAFMLILQQTLLIGAAMLTETARWRKAAEHSPACSAAASPI